MNIVIKTYQAGNIYCRPDTTWERENKDFYSPESVSTIFWTPVVFARINKTGKAVGKKFATRYYDAMNFGSLLYIGDKMPNIASASCADHTSILPFPLYNHIVFENSNNVLKVKKNSNIIFKTNTEGMIQKIEEAICESSILTSLRIGDVIAVELQSPEILCTRENSTSYIEATFCENNLFDFNILF